MVGPELLDVLLAEYDAARRYTAELVDDLDDVGLYWRPTIDASSIAWHLGHQAAVNHFLVRNLVAAEPSPAPAFDAVFDSATIEPQRGDLPPRGELVAYRQAVAERTHARVGDVAAGSVAAPAQLTAVAVGLLVAVTNHEYQHSTWIAGVRTTLGHAPVPVPVSAAVSIVDGYPLVSVPG